MTPDEAQVQYGERLLAEARRIAGPDPAAVAMWLQGYAAGCKASLESLRKAIGMAPSAVVLGTGVVQ